MHKKDVPVTYARTTTTMLAWLLLAALGVTATSAQTDSVPLTLHARGAEAGVLQGVGPPAGGHIEPGSVVHPPEVLGELLQRTSVRLRWSPPAWILGNADVGQLGGAVGVGVLNRRGHVDAPPS